MNATVDVRRAVVAHYRRREAYLIALEARLRAVGRAGDADNVRFALSLVMGALVSEREG